MTQRDRRLAICRNGYRRFCAFREWWRLMRRYEIDADPEQRAFDAFVGRTT